MRKVDMSEAAILRRLRQVDQLRELCLSLMKAKKISDAKAENNKQVDTITEEKINLVKKVEKTNFVEDEIDYRVSSIVANDELNELFANAWGNDEPIDFQPILERSLAVVCAYYNARLIGFVNIAWDGGVHGFVLDTTVHTGFRRRGIGLKLVEKAATFAKERGLEWLHIDFEPHLQTFYDKCGFKKTNAGLINLRQRNI